MKLYLKILFCSDSATMTTGYGQVSKILCKAFAEAGHSIVQIGYDYKGEPHDLPFSILKSDRHLEFCGENTIKKTIKEWQPDLLFSLGDPWSVEKIPSMSERQLVKWMYYFPLDGYPVPKMWHHILKDADYPVTFSKFALNLAKEIITDKDVHLIYHGVETDKFYKLEDKQEHKRRAGIANKFIVGMVARNNPRKNIPVLIKAFAEFAKDKPDVGLYLHTVFNDVGWDINELIERYNLKDKMYTTNGLKNPTIGVSDEMMLKVYNFFDIFALPSRSEGFGLPIMEANSCEVPPIVTDFSAMSELVVDKEKQLIKVKDIITMENNLEQAHASQEDLTNKLNYFYHDWKYNQGKEINEIGKKSRELALQFQWQDKAQQFLQLLEKIENELPKEKLNIQYFVKV